MWLKIAILCWEKYTIYFLEHKIYRILYFRIHEAKIWPRWLSRTHVNGSSRSRENMLADGQTDRHVLNSAAMHSALKKAYRGTIDPLGQPKVSAGSDNCFCSCRPSVRPSPLFKQNKFQAKTMFATAETEGLAQWIIDDICLVLLIHTFWHTKHKWSLITVIVLKISKGKISKNFRRKCPSSC